MGKKVPVKGCHPRLGRGSPWVFLFVVIASREAAWQSLTRLFPSPCREKCDFFRLLCKF